MFVKQLAKNMKGGWCAVPNSSAYAACKHALEGECFLLLLSGYADTF